MRPWSLLAHPAQIYGIGVGKAQVLASVCRKTKPKLRAGLVTPGPLATPLTSGFKVSAGHLPCPLCNEGEEPGYF